MKSQLFVGCAIAALASTQVQAQSSQPDQSVEERSDESVAVESEQPIIVTGYRKSVETSVDTKKDSVAVVDAITSEDIGQFPQTNLSESIQRISGVQIRRDFAGGVGNEISLRGLPPEFTNVTINGQTAPSNAEDRTFNFNVFPAELFRKVEVYKSPVASIDEGGLGGTVELQTLRPSDLGERTGAVNVEGVYNEITDTLSPRLSAFVGHELSPTVSALFGVAYSEFSAASQSYDAVRWTRRDFDADGDGAAEFMDVFLMDLPRLIHQQQDVERLSLIGSVEFEPTDDFSLLLEASYVDNVQQETRLTPIWFFRSGSGIREIAVADEAVEFISFDQVTLSSENDFATNDTQTWRIGATADWQLGDWSIRLIGAYSANDRETEAFRYYANNIAPASYDIREDDDYFSIITPTDLADPNEYVMSEARRTLLLTRDSEAVVGLDLDYDLASDFTLEAGVKYRERNKQRERFFNRIRNINEPFAPVADVFTGFLENESRASGGPSSFAFHDPDLAFARYGSTLDLGNAAQQNNFYDVTEQVYAGYVMGTYETGPILANAGVRLVGTEVTSVGSELDRVTNQLSNIEVGSSYFDALPSANIRFEIAENLFLRTAAARVLTRPSLSDLAAYRVVDDVNLTISARNPELDPFRANQVDFAVEWYFADGGLLSAGYFYKDIESFIGTETRQIPFNGETYTITQPVNRNNATIEGVEVNYIHPFTFLPAPFDGFGIVANYTYTDSSFVEELGDGSSLTYGLPENSQHSFNLTGYYENDIVSLRLSHNYRERFLREVPNIQDGLKFRDDVSVTDFAGRVYLSDTIQLTLDILNIFESKTEEFVFDERLTDGIFTTGRTFQFGVRAKF